MSFIRLRRYAPFLPLVALAAGGVALMPADSSAPRPQVSLAKVEPVQPSYLAVPIATVDPLLLKAAAAKPAPVRPSLTVTTAAAAALPLAAAALPEETAEPAANLAHVGASALNVRAGPSSSTAKLFVLQPGTQVATAETEGGWIRIIAPDGQEGWVYSRYLTTGAASEAPAVTTTAEIPASEEPADEVRQTQRSARVAGRVALRASPSQLSERLFVLEPGERVAIAERRGKWARVVVDGGVSGWVRLN